MLVFLGFWYSTLDNVFKDFVYPTLSSFKVLQMFTLQNMADLTNFSQEFLYTEHVDRRTVQLLENITGFVSQFICVN